MSRVESLVARLTLRDALIAGALLRLAWILLCPNEPTSDQGVYHTSAEHISAGRGYLDDSSQPAGWYPVGYSAFVALFYAVLGPAYYAAFLANLALGVGAIGAAFVLGKALYDERVGRLSAWIVALYPSFVLYTTCIASENAFLVAELAILALLVRALPPTGPIWSGLALVGVAMGLGAYVRAPALFFLVVVPLIGWRRRLGVARTIAATALVGAVAVALLLPWGFRNHAHFGRFALVSMNGDSNLWMGNHEGTDGGYHPIPPDVRHLGLVEREAELGRRAKAWILGNPGAYAWTSIRRVAMTLRSDTIAPEWNRVGIERRLGEWAVTPLKLVTSGAYILLLVTAIVAFVRRRRALTLSDAVLGLAAALASAPFVLIVGGNRYHFPLLPLLMVFAATAAIAPSRPTDEPTEPR